jgi:hypothetical protein
LYSPFSRQRHNGALRDKLMSPGGWELAARIAIMAGLAGLLGTIGRLVAVALAEEDHRHGITSVT